MTFLRLKMYCLLKQKKSKFGDPRRDHIVTLEGITFGDPRREATSKGLLFYTPCRI